MERLNIKITNIENPIVDATKIKLYKEVFGENPWNEGYICSNCGKNYNRKFIGKCFCGNGELKPFYQNKELKEELKILPRKVQYQEILAKNLDKTIGFLWGWKSSLKQINKDKLKINDLQNLKENILYKIPDFNLNNFYYLAEIGVNKKYRGNDIAGKMYRKNIEILKQKGLNYILVRTTKKTDVPYKWLKKIGYKEVYDYNDEQQRVILVCKIK